MNKQAVVLASMLALLLAAVFFVNQARNSSEKSALEASLLGVAQDDVAAFEINNFTEGLYFKKHGDAWLVKPVKTELAKAIEADANAGQQQADAKEAVAADPVKVSTLLTNLSLLKSAEPVATEKESVGKFQINEHSLHIILYDRDNKELGRLYVGKTGPDFMSTFVKRGDSDAVYLVQENLQGIMNYHYEQWQLGENKESGS